MTIGSLSIKDAQGIEAGRRNGRPWPQDLKRREIVLSMRPNRSGVAQALRLFDGFAGRTREFCRMAGEKRFFLALAVFAFVLLTAEILSLKSNVPVYDDYVGILSFLNDVYRAESISDVIQSLVTPHNEHRIIVTRAVALSENLLFGETSFVRLTLVPIFGLVLCAFIGGRIAFEELGQAFNPVMVSATGLLFARPENWKHLIYTMANIQAIGAFVFAMAFIYFFGKNGRRNHALAVLALGLALMTNSSSILLFGIGAVGSLALARWRSAALYLFSGGLVAHFYMGGGGLFGNLVPSPVEEMRFAIGVLGSASDSILPGRAGAAIVAGIGICLVFLWIFLSVPIGAILRLKLLMLYVLGVAALVGLGRGELYSDNWTQVVFDGRYRIASVTALWLVCCCALVVFRHRLETVRPVLLTISVFTLMVSYSVNLPEYERRNALAARELRAMAFENKPTTLQNIPNAHSIVRESIALGVYRPPEN